MKIAYSKNKVSKIYMLYKSSLSPEAEKVIPGGINSPVKSVQRQ
jgi:hypothetical protein